MLVCRFGHGPHQTQSKYPSEEHTWALLEHVQKHLVEIVTVFSMERGFERTVEATGT